MLIQCLQRYGILKDLQKELLTIKIYGYEYD